MRVSPRKLVGVLVGTIAILCGGDHLAKSTFLSGGPIMEKSLRTHLSKTGGGKLPPPDRPVDMRKFDELPSPHGHLPHDCVDPLECYSKLRHLMDRYMSIAESHDSEHLKWAIPITDSEGDETVFLPTRRSQWHMDMAVKYCRAAAHPWLPVAPDTPEPD